MWFSDDPLTPNEGAWGDRVLSIELDEDAIADFQWVEEPTPYREWLVPATVANAAGKPEVVERP